jgi:CRISPR/Cas system-associated exonuclease Cas4 (RecB family)
MPLEDLPIPIKEYILKNANGEDYYNKPNTYSLTELLYCTRKSFYKRTIPQKTTLESAFNMYRGRLFDKEWSPLFRHNQVRSTYRCKNIPVTISGKYDFLTEDNEGHPILVDLKTTKSLYYVTEPSEEYKTQVRFYAYLNSIDHAQILYIDFGDCKKFDVEVGDCSKLFEDLEAKATQLYFALKTGKVPAKENGTPTWMCKTCDYNKQCGEL